MSEIKTIKSGLCCAKIDTYGAMTTAEFNINGRIINPFYVSSWREKDTADEFLRHLKGDFFCAPFGAFREDGTEYWKHGYSSHAVWKFVSVSPDRAELELDYPDGSLMRAYRRINIDNNSMIFEDTLLARKDTEIPVGIHPVFKLPENTGEAVLKFPSCEMIKTYPRPVDASSVFDLDRTPDGVHEVPLISGGKLDVTQLPLPYNTEEVLVLGNVECGEIMLENKKEAYRVILEWDKEAFKSCLLWFSNRGRKHMPWNGNNLCLGIEPVTSAFDLGNSDLVTENKLNDEGIKTRIFLKAGESKIFRHKIRVEGI